MPIGIPAAMLITAGIGAGTQVAGSALANRSKKTYSKTTPTWDPANQGLLDRTRASIDQTLANPGQYVDPLKMNGIEKINRRFRDAPGRISEQLAQRGYGSSSALGKNLFATEMNRFGQLSDWDATIAQMMLGEKNNAINQSQNLLNLTRGTESEGTAPGNAAGAGLASAGNGLENIATLMMLSKVLNGSGTGGVSPTGAPWPGANGAVLPSSNPWSLPPLDPAMFLKG